MSEKRVQMSSKNLFRGLRRQLVSIKYLLQRGYAWLQTPTLCTIGAGVIKPYFPGLHFWQLILIAMSLFLIVGWIDRKFKFIHEEQNLVTKMNPTLMKGLYGKDKDGDK